MESFFMLQLGL